MGKNVSVEEIKKRIYEARGKLVMLDSDVACICNLETKRINEAVKNNVDKFSEGNCFKISKDEVAVFLDENFDQKNEKRGGRYNNPRVFTIEGIEILSTILKSKFTEGISKNMRMAFEEKNNEKYNIITSRKPVFIEDLIYESRGMQIMLDEDLAELYQCKNGTKEINQAVKNNGDKFPERFSWVLSEDEYSILRSKFLTAKMNGHNKKRFMPRVFTEQGVAMLATILKTPIATQVSIQIMDAFVSMRRYCSSGLVSQNYINELVIKDNKRIDLLEEAFTKFEEKRKTFEIYYDGQIYDAYSKLVDIMFEAKNELIIIDGYADKTILDMIAKLDVPVMLIMKKKALLTELDIAKYNAQYRNLTVLHDDTFHDRYFIVDREVLFHCGASVNYAGSKTFSINRIDDEFVCEELIKVIDKIRE